MDESIAVFQLPESVKQDMRGFRAAVDKFLRGETTPVAFRAYRVPHGIYEQREVGRFMVRVRIAAGMVLPHQMDRLAELSRTYGDGILHVTTRQDIQIHKVDIEKVPDVLESLLEVGLSPRGGGGNTVRNITACPRAGVCSAQAFDVRPWAIATTEYLLDFPSSFNLPRKFKLVFSGCEADCALASVADLGFFAHVKDGTKGFSVYGGGGLGSNSRVGVKIEDFVAGDEVIAVAEAMKRVFDAHGDRLNKHRARLRYVLGRVGEDEFVRLYREQRDKLREEKLQAPQVRPVPEVRRPSPPEETGSKDETSNEYTVWRERNVVADKADGEYTVRLRLTLGDIPVADFEKVASLARQIGEGFVRTTQAQNLLLCGVREDHLPFAFTHLKDLHTDVVSRAGPELVVCAGASTCKLGLCKSRDLAMAMSAEMAKSDWPVDFNAFEIRVSGCPNSCGQHHIGAIGLQGLARRVVGKLVPCYLVLCGGTAREGEGSLATHVGEVPAKNIPALTAEILTFLVAQRSGDETIESVIARCSEGIGKLVAARSEIPSIAERPDVYCDFGSTEEFSLAGRGPGECGAGVMDVIQFDIDEAKQALAAAKGTEKAKDKSDALCKAIVAAARSLLITRGQEPRKEREIFAAFDQHMIQPGWVAEETKDLLNQVLDYRLGDTESIAQLTGPAGWLVERVDELFRSLDASLDFKAERIPASQSAETAEPGAGHLADLRGVACPMNFVRAKLELEKIPVGEVLDVLLDDGEPVRNVPASFAEQGQEVLEVTACGEHFRVRIQRNH